MNLSTWHIKINYTKCKSIARQSPYNRLENNMIVLNFFGVDFKHGENYLLYSVKGGLSFEHHSNILYCSYKTIQSWKAFKHFSYIFFISLKMVSNVSNVWVKPPTSLLILLFKSQYCWKENSLEVIDLTRWVMFLNVQIYCIYAKIWFSKCFSLISL